LVVTRSDNKDVMTLQFNATDVNTTNELGSDGFNTDTIADSLKQFTGLSGSVTKLDTPLPNDGVVVDDQRDLTD